MDVRGDLLEMAIVSMAVIELHNHCYSGELLTVQLDFTFCLGCLDLLPNKRNWLEFHLRNNYKHILRACSSPLYIQAPAFILSLISPCLSQAQLQQAPGCQLSPGPL